MRTALYFAALTLLGVSAQASTTYAFNTTTVSYSGSGTVDTSATCTALSVESTAASYCVDFAAGGDTQYVIAFAGAADSNGLATSTGNGDVFGYFQLFCTVDGTSTTSTACGSATFSGSFTLTVPQTTPASFDGEFIDTVNGSATAYNAGSATVNFSTQSSFIYPGTPGDPLEYALSPATELIGSPAQDRATSVEGIVTDLGTPEPATFGLMGVSLLGVGFALRRKRR